MTPRSSHLAYRRVQYADYPGITPDPDHTVRGMYVTGLTEANLAKLDAFEGDQYERKTVKARLLTKVGDDEGKGNVEGEEVECEVYVFLAPDELEDREWDFHEFRTQKMKKWTRADYGFEDTDHFAPREVGEQEKSGAVCKWNASRCKGHIYVNVSRSAETNTNTPGQDAECHGTITISTPPVL